MFQRFLTYVIGIMLLVVASLATAPLYLDLTKYKNDFSAVIKNVTGVTPTIDGKVSVIFFPTPGIALGRISVPNVEGGSSASILTADGVEAHFTLESLLHGTFDPRSITLIKPRLDLEQMENGEKNWVKIFEKNDAAKINQTLNSQLNIIIKNGDIAYREGDEKKTVNAINSTIKVSSVQGPFKIKGNFLMGTGIVKFSGNMGRLTENSTAEFSINSDIFNFVMKGDYRPGKDYDMHGTAVMNIKDIGKFIDSFLITDPILAQIKSDESLALKGDFLISGEIASFNKLTLDADSIKGSGNIDLLYGSGGDADVQWDVALNVEKINLDSLRTPKNKPKTDHPELVNYYTAGNDAINFSAYHFDLPTDISALFSLSVAEAIYNNDKISHLSIDTDIFNGKAIIHSFSADLPGNSRIELTGNVDHNGTRPLLIGKITATGDDLRKALTWLYPEYSFIPEGELKEFLLSCDLNITPRKMNISNIYGSVDKSLLNGSLFIRPSDTIPSIKLDVKLDRMDFDRYNATAQIDKYVREFFATAREANIDTSWLKIFRYKLALSVSGDEIVYNGNNIRNFSTAIGMVKGLMSVQSLNIDSELVKLNGQLMVDFNKETPEINVDVTANYFDSGAFILAKPVAQNESAQAASTDYSGSIWSKDEFNLMGLHRFAGKLNLAFDTFKYNTVTLRAVEVNGELKKDIFAINKLSANWGDAGKISIKGNVSVSREAPSIGVSIVTSAINMQDLFKAIGSENKTQGLVYFGGVVKTFGLSPYEWVKELQTTAKLALRNVMIQGIDLSTIIEQSRLLYSVIDMNTVLKNATQDGETWFNSIDGQITTDKSILQAKDFQLATEKSRGVFAGNLSLHSMKMKGLAKISYMPESDKQVTLGLNLEGTMPDAVTYTLDSTNLEQYITGKANR